MNALVVALLAVGIAAAPLAPLELPTEAPPASRASLSSPGEVVGGVNYMCALLGLAVGLQVGTGHLVGAGVTLISAYEHGCLW